MSLDAVQPDPFVHDRLIEAVALHRDREAFAELFSYFAPRLKAWLIKSGATPGAAEDFAQDAMLTVWRKADLFDARKARAATWIFTIARNRRLDITGLGIGHALYGNRRIATDRNAAYPDLAGLATFDRRFGMHGQLTVRA